jgi:hypothetical protein
MYISGFTQKIINKIGQLLEKTLFRLLLGLDLLIAL